MKGLELSKRYFEECGKGVLEGEFAEDMPFLAIGLAGSGSECLGFDDELSQDHDFEPGFCIFLPDEAVVDRRRAFLLERAYAKLPKEFMGYTKNLLSPVGGNRHGVIRMEDFFRDKVGSPDGRLRADEWFSVPEQGLLEATNGEVFADLYGQFTEIRDRLRYFPEDVRLKKLAGRLLLMGQSGQYNYPRCAKRGDSAAAQLACAEFVQSGLHTIYLLNKTYMPYYKWSFKGLGGLPRLAELSDGLEYLISAGNRETERAKKLLLIEEICSAVAEELAAQNLTEIASNNMERQAYAVNEKITNHEIRTRHVLYGV